MSNFQTFDMQMLAVRYGGEYCLTSDYEDLLEENKQLRDRIDELETDAETLAGLTKDT